MVRNLLQDPLNTGARSGTSRVEQWIYCPVHDMFYISKVFVVLQFLLHLKLVLFMLLYLHYYQYMATGEFRAKYTTNDPEQMY